MSSFKTDTSSSVYKYIISNNKLNIILNYDSIKSFSDLRLFSHFLMKRVSTSHNNLQCPTTLEFLSENEKIVALESIKKGITNIGIDEVIYKFNELGYRGSNELKYLNNGIGTFGCSFTFGEAMPEEKTFTHILENKLQEPIFNFGIPGAGIQKIAKSFCTINNFYKLKKAIFVLPSLYRYEYIFMEESGKIDSLDFLPSWPLKIKNSMFAYESVYDAYDEYTFLNEFIKNINLIKLNAKLHKTDVIFTTWDYILHQHMRDLKIDNPDDIPKIRFIEQEMFNLGENVTTFARDGKHPGLETNIVAAETIYNRIKKNIYKNKLL